MLRAGATWHQWRRLVAITIGVYLVVRAPAVLDRGSAFDGVGMLWWRSAPVGRAVLVTVWAGAVCGCLWIARRTEPRPSTVIATVGAALVVLTHRSSLGQILWFDTLPALHLIVVGLVAALSSATEPGSPEREEVQGWGLRLAALLTIATYVVAGVAKLRIGGFGWVDDNALARHVTYTAARADMVGARVSPLAGVLSGSPAVLWVASVATLLVELGAPVALLGRRAALVWSSAMWLIHLGIAAAMFTVFHWPLLGVAFVPVVVSARRTTARSQARRGERSTPRR